MSIRDRLTVITGNPWPWITGAVIVGVLLFAAWCNSYNAGKAKEAEGRAKAAEEEVERLRASDAEKQKELDEVTAKFNEVAEAAQKRIQELQSVVDSSRARARSLERTLETERARSRPIIEAVRHEPSSDLGESTQELLRQRDPGAMFVLDLDHNGFTANRAGAIQIKQALLENETLRFQAETLEKINEEQQEQIKSLNLVISEQDKRFSALDARVSALEDSLSHERELTAALTRQVEAKNDQIKHMRRAGRMRTIINFGGLAATVAVIAATR